MRGKRLTCGFRGEGRKQRMHRTCQRKHPKHRRPASYGVISCLPTVYPLKWPTWNVFLQFIFYVLPVGGMIGGMIENLTISTFFYEAI